MRAAGRVELRARLRVGESLGDRLLKVDHAGEHGAVCIYRAQRFVARWRCPELVDELSEFLQHERRHRALFAGELSRRKRRRCRSYFLCAAGGFSLGFITGLLGSKAIVATTVAIERVVLRHLSHQLESLGDDPAAQEIITDILGEEQEHLERSEAHDLAGFWPAIILQVVSRSTETVIWLGMKL